MFTSGNWVGDILILPNAQRTKVRTYAYECRSGGSAFAAIHSQQPRLIKEGKGSNATGTADEEQEEPGADLLDKLEKGSGSTGRFITYYMETIFRAEPWWRARNRDGAFAGPGPWGPRSVFTLGIGCTLTYPTCMPGLLHYTMRLGSGRPGLGGGGGCGGGGAEGAGLGLRATTLLCSLTAAPDYQDGPRVQEPGELGELGRDHRDKAAAQEALRW